MLSPFELVSKNLRSIGALSIHDFLSSGPEELARQDLDLPYNIPPSLPSSSHRPSPVPPGRAPSKKTPPPPAPDTAQNVARLHHACQHKQCILTITRQDGAVRSYKSQAIHRRKNDAKAQLKDICSCTRDTNHTFEEIEDCCREWRGHLVRAEWFEFEDAKAWNTHGAVLRIQLAPHCYRVYSCEPIFDSASNAREHCAGLAIGEGVLEFIRHGNGQTAPQSDTTPPGIRSAGAGRSLQQFYESLPRPFEEPFEDKTAAEINAAGWLGTLLAGAKGARFTADFYFVTATSETAPPRIMQGCLLRLKRPGECRSYFADPQFPSQKDAKAAVALLALSQDAGKYIRGAGAAVEARVTPEMRQFVLTSVFPMLATETQRIGGAAPHFEFSTADDAFGCRLQVALDAAGADVREYAVPAEYRSKTDAKTAVAYLAAEKGVVDLLRFGSAPHGPTFDFRDGVPPLARNPKKKKKKKNKRGAEDDGGRRRRSRGRRPWAWGRAGAGAAAPAERRGVLWAAAWPRYLPTPMRLSESARRRSGSLEDGERPISNPNADIKTSNFKALLRAASF
ncbi:hypothetical protein B0H17DRAFT_1103805 [Mycena rosella]|uniref:Uncharacterized protein n=1 Tax=Mycena rosella TaxID=1033263 RepID=A0AAD7CDJ2_MYCRO|nr:hypothetical protein B0H17DRAFT_1103805 [Mycena rosella]